MFVLAHIFSNKIEVAYQEAVALRRQEDLIREEAESEKKTKLRSSEKDKKSKKKQAKQKRSNRKAKDKMRNEKLSGELDVEHNLVNEMKEFVIDGVLQADEKSDISDSVDVVGGEAQHSDSEDRGTDTSDNHFPAEVHEGSFFLTNGSIDRKSPPRMDDSSSTCSTDSVASVFANSLVKGKYFPQYRETSLSRKSNPQHKAGIFDGPCQVDGVNSQSAEPAIDTGCLNKDGGSCKVAAPANSECGEFYPDIKNLPIHKEALSPPNKISMKEKSTVAPSTPLSPPKISPSSPQIKSVSQKSYALDPNAGRKKLSLTENPYGQSIPPVSALPSKATSRPERHPVIAPKLNEKSVVHQMPPLSRPSSAPIVPAHVPVSPASSTVKATPHLARSVSVASRLGPDSLSPAAHSFIPQSYRNVMMGNIESASSSLFTSASGASVSSSSPGYMNPSISSSPSTVIASSLNSMDQGAVSSEFNFGSADSRVFNSGSQWMDSSERENNIIRNSYLESSSLAGGMQNLNVHSFLRSGSLEYFPAEFQPRLSGHQVWCPPEEFPHIDIINDLLDDEFALTNAANSSGSFHSFSNGNGNNNSFNQLLNRQFSFPSDLSLSGGYASSTSSPRLGRTQSYHDDGLHRSYNSYSSLNSQYDPSTRDLMPQGSGAMNFQTDCYHPSQWQMPKPNLHSPLSMQNAEGDGYLYHMPDYSNLMGGANGYGNFRPANGR